MTDPELPFDNVYSVQVGDRTFKVSGRSLCSDAPSRLTDYFKDRETAVLYIDRDAGIYTTIFRFLQGYHIEPRNVEEFTNLFTDALFMGLNGLCKHLQSLPWYVRVGTRDFQLDQALFESNGNGSSYFSLFMKGMFARPTIDARRSRLSRERPPMAPPGADLPNRDPDVFEDIVRLLKGYSVGFRDDEQRDNVLRDVRYFRLMGVESRILPARVTEDTLTLRIMDVKFAEVILKEGYLHYARPYLDERPRLLLVQMDNVRLRPLEGLIGISAAVETRLRMIRLPELPTAFTVVLDDAHILLNGEPYAPTPGKPSSRKRARVDDRSGGSGEDGGEDKSGDWVVEKGVWRIRAAEGELILEAQRLRATTQEASADFL